jgi:hypothetical protein
MDEMLKATVRIIEIAELVGVSHQQANKIADAPGFPSPVEREGQSRLWDRRRSRLGQRSGGVGGAGCAARCGTVAARGGFWSRDQTQFLS